MSVTIKLYNLDGNIAGDMEAPEFLSARWNPALAHQVFKAIAANMRQPIAHTKNRGEVRGGAIKPWKQKGTGRARHGSIRSPLWRHGGITFGPRNTTIYTQKVNKKMRELALDTSLAQKLSSDQLKIVESLSLATAKTKDITRTVRNLTGGKSTLLVLSKDNKNALKAAANLPRVTPILAKDLNALNVLTHTLVVMEKSALAEINRQII